VTSDVARREREAILHDLASPDEEMRRLAVERLLSLPIVESLPQLLAKLGDASWRVRKAAVARLVSLSERHPVEDALIDALSDGENSGRRNSAFEALVGIGRRITPRLVAALASEDVDVRKLLVDVLGAIGDPDCTHEMIAMLHDEDPNVRGAAADALGVCGDEEAAQALKAVATGETEDQLVRLSALRALARLELPMGVDELGAILDASLLRPAGFGLLGLQNDEAAVECLLKGVTSDSRASREAAMQALLRVISRSDHGRADEIASRIAATAAGCDSVVGDSLDRLQDADLSTRLTLIQFLGLAGDPRAAIPILQAARDEAIAEVAFATLESMGTDAVRAFESGWDGLGSALRADACALIGRCGGEASANLLIAALDDVDTTLRANAARALGEMRCIEALPDLVRRLDQAANEQDDELEDEVAALVGALVALAPSPEKDPDSRAGEVIDVLSAHLDGAGEEVRLAIATVLGRIGRVEDEELVARLLKDPSARIRRAAVEALSRLEAGAASESLRLALADEAAPVRIAAAVALGHSTNAGVIDDLQRLIHDEDPRVSSAAVRAIGAHCCRDNVSPERAIELIEPSLRVEGMVSLAAMESLCMIGGPVAARTALRVLDRSEPELVQAAVVCVGAHGDADAVAELIGLVGHDGWSVRAEAIQTLADRRIRRAVPAILRRLETEQDAFVRDTILRSLRQLED
jgi:HEAT repeat protein